MKLLLDANISWRLTVKLKLHFEDCFHVDHIGISVPAKDMEIWNYALSSNSIIITNDNDFLNLAEVKGFPPKVVVLHTGNQSNNFIEEILIKHKGDIDLLNQSDDYGFLEIF
jgi:predicted nuclease of predicted toxin-antitoxin system